MSTTASGALQRCPRCSAHVRAGSDWCTLCYIDLRPEPVRTPAATVPADLSPAAPSPVAAPAAQIEGPAAPDALLQGAAAGHRGKHARPAPATSPGEAEELAAQLLAQLAVSESGVGLGKFTALVDTSGKKIGLMIGGTLAAIVLLFALMAIVGSLLF